MKKALLAVIVLLLLIVGFGAWLWKLGAPPTLASSVAQLEDVQGTVETRPDVTSGWTKAANGQTIQAGTHIRTGADGSVTFTVSGVSQTRLSTSTEISVDSLVVPQSTNTKSQTGITLVTGRTWSRIVRLLELDSSYSVTTDDVVATVRGTAFETARLPGKETWIAVFDGKVKAADRVMQKGNGMMKKARGKWRYVSSTQDIPQNKEWINKNVESDQQFLKETQTELKKELTKDLSGAYELLGGPAERLHMALANSDEKAALADQYLSRRVAWAKELADSGQADQAKEELLRVKNEMQAWMQQVPLEKQDGLFANTMVQSSVLYHDEVPVEPTMNFLKEKMDAMKTDLAPVITPEQIKQEVMPIINDKLQLDRVIDPVIQQQPIIEPQEKIDPITFTAPTISSQPTARQLLEPRTPTQLTLSCPQTTLRVKEDAPIMAIAIYSNGTQQDVTQTVTLVSSDPSIGTVMGNRLVASGRPGRVQVTATYRENGMSVTGNLVFEILP